MSPTKEAPPQERKLSDKERVDRLEAAVGALGLNLPEYDSDEVKRAREQIRIDAEKAARKAVEGVVEKAIEPLSTDERIARLEQLAATGLGISLDEPAQD